MSNEIIPEYFWHVTSADRMKSIHKNGLTMVNRRRWSNAMGVKLGRTDSIYLLSHYGEAVRWAGKMEFDFDMEGKIVILKVKAPETLIPERSFESAARRNSFFMTPDPISPEDIVRVIPLTRDLLRELVRTNGDMEPPSDENTETMTLKI